MNFYLKVIFFTVFLLCNVQSQEFWEQLNGPPGGRIVTIAVSPSGNSIACGTQDPARIYISTNSGESWIKSNLDIVTYFWVWEIVWVSDSILFAASNKVYLSTDGGFNWHISNLPNSNAVYSLAVDSSGYIYAGLEDQGRIYRSTNTGVSWISVFNSTGRIWDIYIDHRNVIYAGYRDGIIRSSDQGISWENCYGLPSNLPIHSITSDTTGLMFAMRGTGPTYVFYSSDYGINWSERDSVDILNENESSYKIFFTNERLYLVTSKGVLVSTDYGYDWQFINDGFYHKDARSISKGIDNVIYVGTDGSGVFKSTNWGENWIPTNRNLNNSYYTKFAFDEDSNMFAAAGWNAPYKSTDGGNIWEPMLNGISSFTFYSIYYTKNRILFLGTENGLFRSYDKGNSFELLPSIGSNFFEMISEDLRGNIYVCTFGTGLWRSKDDGDSWEFVSTPFSNQYTFSFTADSSGNIYAGARYSKIYRSTDSGNNWQEVTTGITAVGTVFTMTSSPKGYIYAGILNGGVFRSTDMGDSWEEVNNGISNYIILYITSNKKNELFVSNDGGYLHYSDNDGESWINASFNLFPTSIWDIEFDKEGYIYLGTDESIWKSIDTVVTSVTGNTIYNEPASFKLYQNYPNPFNPVTTIKYDIVKAQDVKLAVYDILGREVTTLVSEQQQPNSYEVSWDASNFASGIYFYTLTSGNFISTKKLILLK